MGLISLRRRIDPVLQAEVYEVKLDDEFLMSSSFTVAEQALAQLGLGEAVGDRLDVLVGGLGLGYTAVSALRDPRVASLTVVDAVPAVLEWHHRGLLPESASLTADPRTALVQGDFFALMRGEERLAPQAVPGGVPALFHAILLDVDHSPRHVLHPSHQPFYTVEGLQQLRRHLRPTGVFGLWSDDPPDQDFSTALDVAFPVSRAEVVSFPNPLTRGESTATIYLAVAE